MECHVLERPNRRQPDFCFVIRITGPRVDSKILAAVSFLCMDLDSAPRTADLMECAVKLSSVVINMLQSDDPGRAMPACRFGTRRTQLSFRLPQSPYRPYKHRESRVSDSRQTSSSPCSRRPAYRLPHAFAREIASLCSWLDGARIAAPIFFCEFNHSAFALTSEFANGRLIKLGNPRFQIRFMENMVPTDGCNEPPEITPSTFPKPWFIKKFLDGCASVSCRDRLCLLVFNIPTVRNSHACKRRVFLTPRVG